MTNRLYLLVPYRQGYHAALSWRQGQPIRCPYLCLSRWMAWHAGFDRGLYVALDRPSLADEPTG